MARPLRVQIENGIYHVVARGNERAPIFGGDTDRRDFLALLQRIRLRFGWYVLSYCLMDNHYHLLVQTPIPNLARGMQQLNSGYVQSFNRRHGRDGHLFQGRYKSPLILSESHLFAAFRYIALNPVDAALCKRPEDWRWSSHRALLGRGAYPAVDVRIALRLFDDDLATAQRHYVALVEAEETQLPTLGDAPVLGDREFVMHYAPDGPRDQEISTRDWHIGRPGLAELLTSEAPNAIATAYRQHGYTLKQIAAHLGLHYSTVSRRLRAWEDANADSGAV
jgi:REP element-mobilizing transposase RayT/AraC-like DNA-binding protein